MDSGKGYRRLVSLFSGILIATGFFVLGFYGNAFYDSDQKFVDLFFWIRESFPNFLILCGLVLGLLFAAFPLRTLRESSAKIFQPGESSLPPAVAERVFKFLGCTAMLINL